MDRVPAWQVDGWVSTYTAIAAAELAGVSDTVARIAGHERRSLGDVLHAQAEGVQARVRVRSRRTDSIRPSRRPVDGVCVPP